MHVAALITAGAETGPGGEVPFSVHVAEIGVAETTPPSSARARWLLRTCRGEKSYSGARNRSQTHLMKFRSAPHQVNPIEQRYVSIPHEHRYKPEINGAPSPRTRTTYGQEMKLSLRWSIPIYLLLAIKCGP